jgi:hypothetical protein
VIGWIGLIGRAIAFALEKIAGKKIELTMDQRRKAARIFLRLYHAVLDLELLSKELMVELRAMANETDPEISGEWLRNISYAIDETSERFLEATQGIRDVLIIFDPVLARTLSSLEASKFSFLIIAAQGFKPVISDQGKFIEATYTLPPNDLDSFSLIDYYNWYADDLERYPNISDWPRGTIDGFLADDIQQGVFRLKEPESAFLLASLLEQHVKNLAEARELLAQFMRTRFTFEDLLALKEPISRFDRVHAMHRMSDSLSVPYVRWFAGRPPRKIRKSREEAD